MKFKDEFITEEFVLNDDLFSEPEKISKDPNFIKFMSSINTGSRMSNSAYFSGNQFVIGGYVSNTSSSYHSKWFTFKRKPKSFAEFKRFMKTSGAIDYAIAINKAAEAELARKMSYYNNGGVRD